MNLAEQLAIEFETRAAYQPRFLAYCDDQGHEPEAQIAHDREAYPGGCMAGYLCWITQRWGEWRRARGIRYSEPVGKEDQQAFDRWLSGRGWTLL